MCSLLEERSKELLIFVYKSRLFYSLQWNHRVFKYVDKASLPLKLVFRFFFIKFCLQLKVFNTPKSVSMLFFFLENVPSSAASGELQRSSGGSEQKPNSSALSAALCFERKSLETSSNRRRPNPWGERSYPLGPRSNRVQAGGVSEHRVVCFCSLGSRVFSHVCRLAVIRAGCVFRRGARISLHSDATRRHPSGQDPTDTQEARSSVLSTPDPPLRRLHLRRRFDLVVKVHRRSDLYYLGVLLSTHFQHFVNNPCCQLFLTP